MDQPQIKPMTPRDLIDLGYSPEWVALSIRIATQMQMKAKQQAKAARK